MGVEVNKFVELKTSICRNFFCYDLPLSLLVPFLQIWCFFGREAKSLPKTWILPIKFDNPGFIQVMEFKNFISRLGKSGI